MKALEQLTNKVRIFNNNLTSGRYIKNIIEDYEAEICDMNTEEQLFEKGEDASGTKIADYAPYAPFTIQVKRAKGQPYNRVTLRDEGDFHRSVFVKAKRDSFEIWATNWKVDFLTRYYGEQILGLNEENQRELARFYIFPDLLQIAKKILLTRK